METVTVVSERKFTTKTGARMRECYDKQAQDRMNRGNKADPVENLPQGKSRDAVGKLVGVSGKTIDHATKVLTKGEPELIKAVDEARMAVSTAAIVASEPREVQLAAVEDQVKRGCTYRVGERNIKAAGQRNQEPTEERMEAGGKAAGKGRPKQVPVNLPEPNAGPKDTRDVVGKLVGGK